MKEYLDIKENLNFNVLKKPAEIIKDGGIVIFPTETVYGIGTNVFDENAVRRIYNIKERPLNKPISLLVSNMKMVNQVAKEITQLEYKLMEKFFPGPFTIILKKKDIVPNIATSNQETVGIRIPANEITLKLIDYAGVPIATSSSNISSKPSVTNLKKIIKDFEGKVDYFIDGGESKIGIASTIVQVIDGIPHILRKGPISEEQIKDVWK
ncbi:MAG: threonylcarbamoyl-AMP synthase [Clostridia bacterium]|nr:threonylcarbamoyl-AMP synthase [Clostridia bacterium]